MIPGLRKPFGKNLKEIVDTEEKPIQTEIIKDEENKYEDARKKLDDKTDKKPIEKYKEPKYENEMEDVYGGHETALFDSNLTV